MARPAVVLPGMIKRKIELASDEVVGFDRLTIWSSDDQAARMDMRVVPLEAVEEVEFVQPRAGRLMTRCLLTGDETSPENFVLYTLRTSSDFFSPRHRHNFDQVRFQLEGWSDFKDGRLTTGKVGYFPEGTYYGPQTSSEDSVILMLQFGGASGSGYMSHETLKETIDTLKQRGEFRDGVFTWHDEEGRKHNKDGFQAVWEARYGRPMVFPEPRFDRPVFMNPANFAPVPVAGEPGVRERALGEFNQRRTAIAFVDIQPGSAHSVSGGALVFALKGSGDVAGSPWSKHTSVEIRPGETATFAATDEAELLVIRMPWAASS